jgi:hypothetical protein
MTKRNTPLEYTYFSHILSLRLCILHYNWEYMIYFWQKYIVTLLIMLHTTHCIDSEIVLCWLRILRQWIRRQLSSRVKSFSLVDRHQRWGGIFFEEENVVIWSASTFLSFCGTEFCQIPEYRSLKKLSSTFSVKQALIQVYFRNNNLFLWEDPFVTKLIMFDLSFMRRGSGELLWRP